MENPIPRTKIICTIGPSSESTEVKAGDRILLADGLMELVVRSTFGTDIQCSVVTGGTLTSHKGINPPTGSLAVAPPPRRPGGGDPAAAGARYSERYCPLCSRSASFE